MLSTNGDYPTTTRSLHGAAMMQMVKLSGRPWWAVLYRDGHQLYEWGTLMHSLLTPLGLGRTSRWEEIPKDGMVSLRLVCPDGSMGELWGRAHSFFQLKCGVWSIGVSRSRCQAHVIGVVQTSAGDCQCYAWESARGVSCRFTTISLTCTTKGSER